MLEKEFVLPNEALALKELGFNELCFAYYDGNHNLQYMYNGKPEKFTEKRMGVSDSKWVGWISAPTYAQAFKWFDKNYDLTKEYGVFPHHTIMLNYMINGGEKELAELECLKQLIEIVKNK